MKKTISAFAVLLVAALSLSGVVSAANAEAGGLPKRTVANTCPTNYASLPTANGIECRAPRPGEMPTVVDIPPYVPEPLPPVPIADLSGNRWPLKKIVYDSTIYELVTYPGRPIPTPIPLSFERWRDFYRFQPASPAPTDFVKYPWSPTVYAVTFWPGGENAWLWTPLSFQQWRTAGYPTPRIAGWIKGSYYYKWGTSADLYVEGLDGVNHKLSSKEWADSGHRAFVDVAGQGFLKLTWAPELARMTNLGSGEGRPMGYDEWREEAFPTPHAQQRIVGDTFYKECGSSTIWYAGPGMNRPITVREWQAAGSPAPLVNHAPC